ncbi:adaptor protein MecA [Lactobacillus xylocopicola]|uniref:Adaptor protein MecA n=1 Tax=Lactobacillus xylocopicola TaxID=2976676 RepID=A0ABM8BGI7_9LACO|nr:adaptor protein MecA [Lactobacillus xylocopicola]BDR60215.1 adaptor protein MecA [Lactobacillus xylocopicola]
MQVDHINENTIRVRIDKNELARRGLKVLDLLGDKNKIQHFFYSILDEIDTDHTFSQEAPVTFQVMPNSGGLDLLITKVSAKDRDSLAQLLDGEDSSAGGQDSRRTSFMDLADEDEADEQAEDAPSEDKADDQPHKKQGTSKKAPRKQAYCFADLGTVTELAESLQARDLSSSLYFENGQFFLDLVFNDENYTELKPVDAWAIANEYGLKIRQSELARIKLTGKCLIEHSALDQLRHYFGKIKH